jgi:hypothetical protein
MEEINSDKNYISLFEASKLCSYSEPYLRLRARAGKLKSIKLGKKWMTTSAWLDDYAARVQEWRETAQAKKTSSYAAVLIDAPVELTSNLEKDGAAVIEPPVIAAPKAVFPDIKIEETKAPAAVFCAGNEPILPPSFPRRLAAFPPSGQIFPVPEQTRIDNVSSFGWFGALLSGAVCALALFLVMNSGGITNIMNIGSGQIGQANASRALLEIDSGSRQPGAPALPKSKGQISYSLSLPNLSLKDLVDSIARFFGGK